MFLCRRYAYVETLTWKEKKCFLLQDNLTILRVGQFQNEKAEKTIQVVIATQFLQWNINMKYEKWVSFMPK